MPPAEQKESPEQVHSDQKDTVIIFDWDDTLLASSFLSGKGYRLDSKIELTPEIDTQLKELEQSVINVLNLALTFGNVNIITNAETGWVQLSAQKFIPGVLPILNKVKITSARSTFESSYPDAPMQWKLLAFQERVCKGGDDLKTEKNIISFGDSHVEREAVRNATRGMLHTHTKSVKFAERPSMEQLRQQIELITHCFQYIYNHDGDLDLCLAMPAGPAVPTPPVTTDMPATCIDVSMVETEACSTEARTKIQSDVLDIRKIDEDSIPMVPSS